MVVRITLRATGVTGEDDYVKITLRDVTGVTGEDACIDNIEGRRCDR